MPSTEHEIAPLHCKAESGGPKLPSCLSKAAFLSGLKHGTLATSPLIRLITNFLPCILYSNFSFRHFFQILFKKKKMILDFELVLYELEYFTQLPGHEIFQDSAMLTCFSIVFLSSFSPYSLALSTMPHNFFFTGHTEANC